MNAYELADAIEDWDSDGQWDTPAANMLRQQADRIAELEKRKWSEQDIKNACIGARLSEEDFLRIKAYLPIYSTPQTKPLSDDDVEEFEWMLKKYFNYKPDEPAPNLNRIIRTIEARVRGDK